MSEDQLSAFLAAVHADEGLQVNLKWAADIDAAVTIAKGAGFDVSKADWLRYQAKQTIELSDQEPGAAGGTFIIGVAALTAAAVLLSAICLGFDQCRYGPGLGGVDVMCQQGLNL
jgi:predicted ribosomally synthesized peptide with nif11-like leader